MVDRKTLLNIILNKFEGLKLDDFSDRLTLQKRIYLLQLFGIDLGYRYNWYVHGPYCSTLTEDAFSLQSSKTEVEELSSAYGLAYGANILLSEYMEFEKKLAKDDLTKSLEIAASIHFLKHIGFIPGRVTQVNICNTLQRKGKNFSANEINRVWRLLDEYKLISNKKRG